MIGQGRPASPRRATPTQAVLPAGLTRVGAHAAPNRTRISRPRGDEGDLYRRYHDELERAVAHAVHAPRELIEDACQNAWAIMLRAQPDRVSIFGWLYVVATREAFRLCARDRRHIHLETMLPEGSCDAVIADAFSIDDILEARDALEILASLPDRQRADLTLLVAGFSYMEICQMTGGRTYTNVISGG
jgi:DNA-directed RNA polymerase specialized sigma24 family protein